MTILNVDMMEKAQFYVAKYALDNVDGVKRLLADRYIIDERRFKGDTAASDILIDLSRAIEKANLSEKQVEVIALIYGYWQLTQREASEVMGVSQKQVWRYVQAAVEKIADVFAEWKYNEIEVWMEVE
ncbi:DUF134 domain-containing protein [Longirhabdus pacifica]|uniref:DUF134 domain-containing protein n=1 Tax=Longirhabdus pacifica TaxID=2305227 RepID=UPI0010090AA6|nr:DUF134 domain-containing protein [Longirhabdus pacifica]